MDHLFGFVKEVQGNIEINIISKDTIQRDLKAIHSKQPIDYFEDIYFIGKYEDARIKGLSDCKLFKITLNKQSCGAIECIGILYRQNSKMSCSVYIDLIQHYEHEVYCYEKEVKNLFNKTNKKRVLSTGNALYEIARTLNHSSNYETKWRYQSLSKGEGNCIYIPPLFLWNIGIENEHYCTDVLECLDDVQTIVLANWDRNNIKGLSYFKNSDIYSKRWVAPRILYYQRMSFLLAYHLFLFKNPAVVLQNKKSVQFQNAKLVCYKTGNENLVMVLKDSKEKILIADCRVEDIDFSIEEKFDKVLVSQQSNCPFLKSTGSLMDRKSKNMKLQ